MKLVGSRTTDTFDVFSDWDYSVDSADDFAHIAQQIADAAAWTVTHRGNLYVITLINQDGVMWDFSGAYDQFSAEWDALGKPAQLDHAVFEYWIIALKNLKGLYRGFNSFGTIGIEFSTGLARDIYLGRKYDIFNYKNFYAYKQIAPVVEADALLAQVTGLAYATKSEKLNKMAQLNELVLSVSGDISSGAYDAYQMQAKQV